MLDARRAGRRLAQAPTPTSSRVAVTSAIGSRGVMPNSDIDDTLVAAWYQLAVVLIATGDAAGAETTLVKVTTAEPRWASAYTALGGSYYAGGKFAEAMAAYRRASEMVEVRGTTSRYVVDMAPLESVTVRWIRNQTMAEVSPSMGTVKLPLVIPLVAGTVPGWMWA